jgi:hypothetical protein
VDVDDLGRWLEQRLPTISKLNLSPDGIRVKYVLNWGDFVNHSFCVQDGSVQYHLKVTNDVDSINRLERWARNREFAEIGFAGLLFRRVEGRTASFSRNPALVPQLIELAARVYQDQDFGPRFNRSGQERPLSGSLR